MLPSQRLKALIEELEVPYLELEKKTGVPKSTLQRYASGTTKKIPIDIIEAFASALGVSPAYIMGWGDRAETSHTDVLFGALNTSSIEAKKEPTHRERVTQIIESMLNERGIAPESATDEEHFLDSLGSWLDAYKKLTK